MAEKSKIPKIMKVPEESEKIQSLKMTLAGIEKQFGKGSVMKLGETRNEKVPAITTGCLGLDLALGVGGIPRGRIVEIYGPESSGKTTVALHVVAEVQKQGGIASYVDAEHALDPVYAKALGVDIDELYISQPDDGEQALEITEAMVRSGAIDLVVIDSVAALVPRSEISGEMGDSVMGVHARLMSQALRKLTGIANKFDCTVLFINQLREKIGAMTYGPSETTTGGRALKFYASVRIDIRRSEYLKNGTEFIGNRTKAKIAKNKVAPPFKLAEFDIMYGKGISREGDVLDLAAEVDIIKKSGSWYSYQEERIGQGRDNAKKFLSEHPDIFREVENAVRNYHGLDSLPDPGSAPLAEKNIQPEEETGKKKKKTKQEEDSFSIEELALPNMPESLEDISQLESGDILLEEDVNKG